MPALQPGGEIGDDVIVRACDEPERNPGIVEPGLQHRHRLPDLRAGIMIEARQDVRGARHAFDTLIHIGTGHRHGRAVVGRSVIDARKQMTVHSNMNFRSKK